MISKDDSEWLCRQPPDPKVLDFLDGLVGIAKEVVPGVNAVKLGGHFPGSLVLHWENKLFIADTFITVPVSQSSCTVFLCTSSPVIYIIILENLQLLTFILVRLYPSPTA